MTRIILVCVLALGAISYSVAGGAEPAPAEILETPWVQVCARAGQVCMQNGQCGYLGSCVCARPGGVGQGFCVTAG